MGHTLKPMLKNISFSELRQRYKILIEKENLLIKNSAYMQTPEEQIFRNNNNLKKLSEDMPQDTD